MPVDNDRDDRSPKQLKVAARATLQQRANRTLTDSEGPRHVRTQILEFTRHFARLGTNSARRYCGRAMPARTLTVMPTSKTKTVSRPSSCAVCESVEQGPGEGRLQHPRPTSSPARVRQQQRVCDRHEFTDVETAKQSGRTTSVRCSVLEEALQVRAARSSWRRRTASPNIKDYATGDGLGIKIHLVKENEVISPYSRRPNSFTWNQGPDGPNLALNSSEETIKGMTEKARAGIYPSYAPVGYRNVDGVNGKRTIMPDPDSA